MGGRKIFVYADWQSLEQPLLMGELNADSLKGKEVFSFEYDYEWLKENRLQSFDPDLGLFRGRHYAPQDKKLFGIFMDSCPDRWGRLLMKRRESIEAREEHRKERKLVESDFLLGIHDVARMGALRFKTAKDGPFLADGTKLEVPAWTQIRELEDAAFHFESDDGTDAETKNWLDLLLSPGSSLGGARPKATVQDTNGNLWIAKFPSRHDENDTGVWEMVCHELALMSGINVSDAMAERFSSHGTTFLTRRFDRSSEKRRIHFLSAMTVLGKTDGDDGSEDTSYLDLAQFIQQNGAAPSQDLRELWKRIVFSIAVTNTDDHLRNHGFLVDEKGLRLSPMFDVNPNPDGTGLSLNIDSNDNSLDYDLAMGVSRYFGLKEDDAADELKKIQNSVSNWKSVAQRFSLSRGQIQMMEVCFNH